MLASAPDHYVDSQGKVYKLDSFGNILRKTNKPFGVTTQEWKNATPKQKRDFRIAFKGVPPRPEVAEELKNATMAQRREIVKRLVRASPAMVAAEADASSKVEAAEADALGEVEAIEESYEKAADFYKPLSDWEPVDGYPCMACLNREYAMYENCSLCGDSPTNNLGQADTNALVAMGMSAGS